MQEVMIMINDINTSNGIKLYHFHGQQKDPSTPYFSS